MNFRKKFPFLLAAIVTLISFLMIALSPPALAQNTQSFNGTNNISVNRTNFTTYPTNAAGLATGAGIEVVNYNTVGFYLKGTAVNDTSATIRFGLVRGVGTPSGMTNWDTTVTLAIPITVPVQTNTFLWCTNLPADLVGPATWLGVATITNNFQAGDYLTNAEWGLVKKILPLRYP